MPSSEKSANFIDRVSLAGHSGGLVKTLAGFKRQHHTVPEAVNAATEGFLAKLCTTELAAEAEDFFQRARSLFQYKRTELTLTVSSPAAVLTTRDFTFELAYALQPDEPERYVVTRTLHSLREPAAAGRPELNELFAATFAGIVFNLGKGVKVEAVIDAIEARGGEGGLAVDYPSTCEHCVIRVDDVDAEVVCDGGTLEMRFPREAAPAELIEQFGKVRAAFSLSRNRVLAGLL